MDDRAAERGAAAPARGSRAGRDHPAVARPWVEALRFDARVPSDSSRTTVWRARAAGGRRDSVPAANPPSGRQTSTTSRSSPITGRDLGRVDTWCLLGLRSGVAAFPVGCSMIAWATRKLSGLTLRSPRTGSRSQDEEESSDDVENHRGHDDRDMQVARA